jgi:hypothetical protein
LIQLLGDGINYSVIASTTWVAMFEGCLTLKRLSIFGGLGAGALRLLETY